MARVVDPRDRVPKDPGRLARAELVRAATAEDWAARGKGGLQKPGRDGLRLAVAKAPEFIVDADGEIVGVDAWVQLFDERGRELPIDPHRRIVNPPTVPRAGVRLVDTGKVENGKPVMERRVTTDPLAAFWEAVWDSVESAPNPMGWRTRGTVTTVFGIAGDGYVTSNNATYSTARSGASQTVTTSGGNNNEIGQTKNPGNNYFISESFIGFDTSAINDADVVSAVDLDCWLVTDLSTTDFTVEAREKDWGGTLDTADWVAGASLGGLPLLATLATSGIGATGAYKTFTSQAAFLTATNLKTGTVYILLSSSRHRNGDVPAESVGERVVFDDADGAGTTQDPKLTITHAGPGSSPFFTSRPNRIWRLG